MCINLNFRQGEINFLFTDLQEIRRYQQRYFQKSAPTDVITFADGPQVDILICLSKAKAQAKPRGLKLDQELALLMCHGLLHAQGLEDQTESGWLTMRKNEFESLAKTL